jgi:hypothetical protein
VKAARAPPHRPSRRSHPFEGRPPPDRQAATAARAAARWSARIVRVSDSDPAALRFAAVLGLPADPVTLLKTEPYGGSLHVRVNRAARGRKRTG